MYKIYENFLPEEFENYLHDQLTSDHFPWYKSNPGYKTVITDNQESEKWKNSCQGTQLCHQFIHLDKNKDNSFFKDVIIEFLQNAVNYIALDWNIREVNVLRSKSNIQLNNYNSSKVKLHNPPHVDYEFEHLVLLYYVNDSDGDTILFSDKNKYKKLDCISPKKGRLLVFNGNHYHASSPPKTYDCRIVINTDIEIMNKEDVLEYAE